MINELYFNHKISKAKIALDMKVSRNFVSKMDSVNKSGFQS